MSNTHKGEILEIGEIQNVSDTFQKRRFVVDQVYNGQYGTTHNPVPFFLTQEKCAMIDQFNVGQHVIVHFDVKSRPWIKDGVHQLDRNGDTSYFVEIQAWKIEPVVENQQAGDGQAPPQTQQASASADQVPPQSGAAGQGEFEDPNGPDDLPF